MNIPDNALLPRRMWSETVQWRAGHACEDCGRSRQQLVADGYSGRLNAHHMDEDKENNRLENGLCVCPSCHQKRHEKGSHPCPSDCGCRKHARHDVYHGSKPCSDGCSCGRHRTPTRPFVGGSDPCPEGCSCRRHEAKFHGERATIRACNECHRSTRKITTGLCGTCYQRTRRTRLARVA